MQKRCLLPVLDLLSEELEVSPLHQQHCSSLSSYLFTHSSPPAVHTPIRTPHYPMLEHQPSWPEPPLHTSACPQPTVVTMSLSLPVSTIHHESLVTPGSRNNNPEQRLLNPGSSVSVPPSPYAQPLQPPSSVMPSYVQPAHMKQQLSVIPHTIGLQYLQHPVPYSSTHMPYLVHSFQELYRSDHIPPYTYAAPTSIAYTTSDPGALVLMEMTIA